jgi:hypothetical protein
MPYDRRSELGATIGKGFNKRMIVMFFLGPAGFGRLGLILAYCDLGELLNAVLQRGNDELEGLFQD